jgi:phage terminase large subunit
MYDDYDIDYTFSNDYNLDEDAYYEHHAQLGDADLDEHYARDGQDYEALAYRHYA